jgi:hypothetical protein
MLFIVKSLKYLALFDAYFINRANSGTIVQQFAYDFCEFFFGSQQEKRITFYEIK